MDIESVAAGRDRVPRILVTRLRFLGDVIMSTPVIEALKERYPKAQIYYLAGSKYADILEENPYLEGIIRMNNGTASFIRTVLKLRSMKFSVALDLFYNPATANLLFLSGIPVRIGGRRRWRKWLYTMTWQAPGHVRSAVMHHMYPLRLLDVSRENGMPRVYLSEKEREWGRSYLASFNRGDFARNRVVALHPGGTWQSKRWPPVRFGELARRLTSSSGARVLLLTGPGEETIVREVRAATTADVEVMPTRALRETAAVIGACDAVVSNDGGILHLSVALGVPTVGIFGPTEPDIWFPYEGKGPFELAGGGEDCAPCHRHYCSHVKCLEAVDVDEVEERLSRVTGWRRQ